MYQGHMVTKLFVIALYFYLKTFLMIILNELTIYVFKRKI